MQNPQRLIFAIFETEKHKSFSIGFASRFDSRHSPLDKQNVCAAVCVYVCVREQTLSSMHQGVVARHVHKLNTNIPRGRACNHYLFIDIRLQLVH